MTDNTEKYKDYIQHTIIGYLKRMMDGGSQGDEKCTSMARHRCASRTWRTSDGK